MEITNDILLRGKIWVDVITSCSKIFTRQTVYEVFVLCASIGIMYDKHIDAYEVVPSDDVKTVPRTVLWQNRDEMELLFQTAILTSKCVELDEEERLVIAFGKSDFRKIDFLVKFANFGVSKLADCIGANELETMDSIKSYIVSIANNLNLDLNPMLDDDELFTEEDL